MLARRGAAFLSRIADGSMEEVGHIGSRSASTSSSYLVEPQKVVHLLVGPTSLSYICPTQRNMSQGGVVMLEHLQIRLSILVRVMRIGRETGQRSIVSEGFGNARMVIGVTMK